MGPGPLPACGSLGLASAFHRAPPTAGAEVQASGVEEEPVLRAVRVTPPGVASGSLGAHLG